MNGCQNLNLNLLLIYYDLNVLYKWKIYYEISFHSYSSHFIKSLHFPLIAK